MPAGDVVEDFVEQVALRLALVPLVPQMMVRIADRQLGLERRFVDLIEPLLVLRRRTHGRPPFSFLIPPPRRGRVARRREATAGRVGVISTRAGLAATHPTRLA